MGPLTISVVGEGAVYEAVAEELAENLEPASGPVDIEFRFVCSFPAVPYRAVGSVMISDLGIRFSRGELLYSIGEEADQATVVTIASDARKRPLRQAMRRAADWNYLSHPETQAKNFLYDVFDWITQIRLLERSSSYIHASTLTKNGRGLAIMGWGGVGKTTAVLKLCLEDGWAYLSDDLGLVDARGLMYRTPKRMQIYGYNVIGQPALEARLFRNRTLVDLVSWRYRLKMRGPKGVRRRIPARSMVKELGCSTKLTDILFIERSSQAHPLLVPADTNDIARRMAAIVIAEIEPYPSLHRECRAAGITLPHSPEEIERDTASVLARAMEGVPAFYLRVGASPDPDLLAKTIIDCVPKQG